MFLKVAPPIEEVSMRPILIGLSICILGNILISFGLNLQKFVHNQLKLDQYESLDNNANDKMKLNYLKCKLWWFALFLTIFGEGGNFLAYGFAPASLIAPLGTVSLISNAIIAPVLLKETFRVRDAVGILFSILGAAIVVMTNGGSGSDQIPPEEFFNLFLKNKVYTYVAVCCILVYILSKFSKKYGHRFIVIDLAIVGIFGSFTVLSTKGVSCQLSQLGWDFPLYPSNLILVFVLVSTGMVQIKFLNQSLHYFDSTQVIPIQFVSFTLNVVIGSGIVYDDFAKFTLGQSFSFGLGCLCTFVGVYLISSLRVTDDVASASAPYVNQLDTTNPFPSSSNSSLIINIASKSRSIQPLSYSLNETRSLYSGHLAHVSPSSKSNLYSQASSPNSAHIALPGARKKSFSHYGTTP